MADIAAVIKFDVLSLMVIEVFTESLWRLL